MKMKMYSILLATLFLVGSSNADTPANCLFEDIQGTWTFKETARNGDNSISCNNIGDIGEIVHTKDFTLNFPNTVTDELGNSGTWTLIYNQGFEVNINERSYFVFSYYESELGDVTSYCDQTFNGWSRDDTLRNWSCFSTEKKTKVTPRISKHPLNKDGRQLYKTDHKLIKQINDAQTSWTAVHYPEFERYTRDEMHQRNGGPNGGHSQRVFPAPASQELKGRITMLPESWDWRNVEGVNYVSAVRDQGGCGSCYSFASMANLEANIRISSRNERQDVFSTQDPVSCSYLAQGCMGGFDYLIAGRYAMDQGVVAESCNPYTGTDNECVTNTSCSRTYVSAYDHVGEYYGGCNEEEMLEKLVQHGPISVSFMVYDDFHNYNGGIYHHTDLKSDFNPFEVTNHVVLIVGYGSDEKTGEKYWIVKNSWGATWGEDGYFRIRRGTDEVAIESMAVYVTVIP